MRIIVGAAIAAAIAAIAYRRRSLTAGGALAAFVLGTICAAAGWSWAALLIGFFISGTSLSRYKSERKSNRTASIVEKGGNRDAWQVLANGGVFAAAAAMTLVSPWSGWMFAGAGAIAAAASDTWATEIGVLSDQAPRSIVTRNLVTPGESGGVTFLGAAAAFAGAVTVAVVAVIAGWGIPVAVAAVLGGIGGSTVDSLLGATLQTRRWCDRCNTATERTFHTCGSTTRISGGLSWLDNDAVNAASTAFGALLGIVWNLVTGL